MNAVDKLRLAASQYDGLGVLCGNLNAIADEIERDYMRLPVDADGVPVRPGDMVNDIDGPTEVVAVTKTAYIDELGYKCMACECFHSIGERDAGGDAR